MARCKGSERDKRYSQEAKMPKFMCTMPLLAYALGNLALQYMAVIMQDFYSFTQNNDYNIFFDLVVTLIHTLTLCL
jgi:hypothetical protein